jgi:hypothetical protein
MRFYGAEYNNIKRGECRISKLSKISYYFQKIQNDNIFKKFQKFHSFHKISKLRQYVGKWNATCIASGQ